MQRLICSVSLLCLLASVSLGTATSQDTTSVSVLNAEKLPVSLERIKRQLNRLPTREDDRNLLRLSYYVKVYGQAPRVSVIRDFDIHDGPVPYGAPTHAEMIAASTPRLYRTAPAISFPVIGWTRKGR